MKRFVIMLMVFGLLAVSSNCAMLKAQEAEAPKKDAIKIAVTAAFVSDKGMPEYEKMVEYIANKIGKPVEVVSGLSYEDVNTLFAEGKIQVAFVCGYAYTKEGDKIGMELLVAPVMKDPKYLNRPIYYSYVIVPKDSPTQTFADLKGKKYAYSDPLSNSGHNMPRYKLATMGFIEDDYFGVLDYSGSHEKSIEMVARKVYDGASVDSLVWDYDNKYYPENTSKTRILETMGPAGIPPVVVPEKLDLAVKEKLKDIFLNMHNDSKGKEILDKCMVEKFVVVEDSNYDSIRDMESFAKQFLGPKYK